MPVEPPCNEDIRMESAIDCLKRFLPEDVQLDAVFSAYCRSDYISFYDYMTAKFPREMLLYKTCRRITHSG